MTKYFKYSLLVWSLVFALSAIAFGQRTTGDVAGTVTDPKGAVVPGVSVTLSGTNVGFNRTIQSNDDGTYKFQQVPAGTYKITTAAINGFAETILDNVTVTLEKTTTADVALGVSGSVNTVEVSTDPLGVNVDSTDSKVQTNITSALIDQLPKGGSFTSLLKVSPGTRPEPLSGGFQVDGASGSENSFVIDGQTVENYRTGTLNGNNNIPTSLVQEIQVKTSGFEAEHGGASGGVITIQTKGGSDVWHGEFGTVFESSKLQPNPRFATARFASSSATQAAILANPDYQYAIPLTNDKFLNSYPTASLGGAIIKGHAWFYGNYSPQIFKNNRTSNFINSISNANFASGQFVASPRTGTTGTVGTTGVPLAPTEYRLRQKYEYAFSRLDASLFNNLRLSATYLWNPLAVNGQLPFNTTTTSNPVDVTLNGVVLPSAQFYALQGGRQTSNNVTGQAIYTPTSNLVATFRYARGFLNEKPANYGIPNVVRFRCQGQQSAYSTVTTGCPGGLGYQNVTSNSLVTREVSTRNEYNADVTYFLRNFGGNHEFKGGYQLGRTKNDTLSGNAGTGIVSLYYGSTFASLGTSAAGGALVAAESGGSALTDCPVINTTTCLGVGTLYRSGTRGIAQNKYQALFIQDKYQPIKRLTLNLGVRAEKEDLPAYNTGNGATGGQPINFSFKDKVAPRLGAAYDLFGDGKTRIFGSYGWFYDRLKFELPRGSFGGNFYRIDSFRITSAHPNYDYYTPSVILGSFSDPIGGGNPSTTGGISELQADYRIPSNLTPALKAQLGLCVVCGVANDLKPFRQSEATIGVERELSKEYVFSVRATRKNVDHAIEDHAVIGLFLGENYYIGNPGEGTDLQADQAAGYAKSAKPQRLYRALEFNFTKRLSHNYFFNANYTLSKLFGNYSGLASSDEVTVTNANGTVAGRASPGVDRFFDYIINGYTATGAPDNGDLATDRRHALKAYGGYNFDWFGSKANETELSFFQQALQGTPITTFITVVNTAIPLSQRGDLGRTKPFYQTDISLQHRYKFGRDARYTVAFNVDVLNLLNNDSPLTIDTNRYRTTNTITANDIDPTFNQNTQTPTAILNRVLNGQIGTQISQLENGGLPSLAGRSNPHTSTYGLATSYQNPRNVRFGFRFFF